MQQTLPAIWQGFYVETLQDETVKLFVCIDTSGSIDDKTIALIVSEIVGILGLFPNIEGQLYYADAELFGPYPIQDAPTRQAQGGGGTSFVPFFAAIENEEEGVALYITDGYGTFPTEPPKIPVLWAVIPGGLNDEGFPFGDKILRILPSQMGG